MALCNMENELRIGLLLGGLVLVFYLIYMICYAPYRLLKSCGIKGPSPVPFLGNYGKTMAMNALDRGKVLIAEYGSVVGVYIGKKPLIIVSDLDTLKHILVKEFDKFPDHSTYPNIISRSTEPRELMFLKGDRWKTMRKTLTPSFSAFRLKMMLPLFERTTKNLVAVVCEKATSKQTFEVFEVYSNFAIETVLATAFGRNTNLQGGESDQFSESLQLLLKTVSHRSYAHFILLHSHFPWLAKLVQCVFGFSKAGKARDYVNRFALDLINARRENEQTGKYKDLLQLMIDANGEECDSASAQCPAHKMPKTMTDEDVVANCIFFMFVGNETIASTLSYVSYELALYPDIQEKLQSEIHTYFEDKPESSLYTAAQDNVLQETLRLHPPLVESDRYCNETTVINGVTLPKGATIVVPIAVLQQSSLHWKDPKKFDPNRFTAEEKAKRPQMCHIPFGTGPRNCIGRRFSLLETKIAIIELLKRYTFIRVPETEVPLRFDGGISIRPKNGIHLKVIDRLSIN